MKSIRGACLAVAICVACSSAVLSSELSGELQAELSKSVQNVQSDGVGSPGKISDFAVRTIFNWLFIRVLCFRA